MLIRFLIAAAFILECALSLASPLAPAAPQSFAITVNTTRVSMGKVVSISIAWPSPPTSSGTVFWPFVNGSQWGAFVTCFVQMPSDASTPAESCSIELPLPYAGENTLQFAVFEEGALTAALVLRISSHASVFAGRLWGGAINRSDSPVCDEARGCVFVVGQPLPDALGIMALSNAVNIDVEWRSIRLPPEAQRDSVCLDWEPWVCPP